jgi:hypothetical protein
MELASNKRCLWTLEEAIVVIKSHLFFISVEKNLVFDDLKDNKT